MSTRPRSTLAAFALLFVTVPALAGAPPPPPPPPSPVFLETWESAADTSRWRVEAGNDLAGDIETLPPLVIQSDSGAVCSTKYQHETVRAHQGHAFTFVPNAGSNIAVTDGNPYCLTAWVRGSSSPMGAPFIGIADDTAMGANNLTFNFLIGTQGTATTVTSDGAWHWYTADYTPTSANPGDTVYIDIADELWDGTSEAGSSADFDDIALWPGTCTALVAAGGTPPATHQTCSGGKPACDNTPADPTYGQCVQCNGNGDCSGSPATPVCTNHVCVAGCLTDANCTTGQLCDTGTNQCVAGCRGTGGNGCTGGQVCTSTDGSPGTCVQCNGNADCTSTPLTPICTGNVCVAGCLTDADCGNATSGQVCDATSNSCIAGCRGTGGNGCSAATFCTSTNATIGMCTTTCDFTNQCPTNQFCAASTVDAGPTNCVQCRDSADCTGKVDHTVCAPGTFVCVQCTSGNATACSASGNGSACLSNQTCGCAADGDCGGGTSGRICNSANNHCAVGCRGTGGNGCPAGMVCSSTNGSAGTCGAIVVSTDMATATPGADMTVLPTGDDMTLMSSGADMTQTAASPDLSSPGNSGNNHVLGGGGCACDVGGNGNLGSGWLLLAIGCALVLRRRLRF